MNIRSQRFDVRDKNVLIFGGTGSLGTTLTRRLLREGARIGIFSRDEAKNFYHKQKFSKSKNGPEIRYFIGDIRDQQSVLKALLNFSPDVIICAAAMKQVPLCQEFPEQAVMTNVIGSSNIAQAVLQWQQSRCRLVKSLSISTDKAVKPINSYGCTKALQEQIHLNTNSLGGSVLANCVRYGNVLESTGSVIPLFKKQLQEGLQLTVTDERMTRFLLTLDEAVDLIFDALECNYGGNIFIPFLRSAKIIDVAKAMCEAYGFNAEKTIKMTGIRPGEKLHELLISEHECSRTLFSEEKNHWRITPNNINAELLENLFSSGDPNNLVSDEDDLKAFLQDKKVIPCEDELVSQGTKVS